MLVRKTLRIVFGALSIINNSVMTVLASLRILFVTPMMASNPAAGAFAFPKHFFIVLTTLFVNVAPATHDAAGATLAE